MFCEVDPADFLDRHARNRVRLDATDVERSRICEWPEAMLADMAFLYWYESRTTRAIPRKRGDRGSGLSLEGRRVDVVWSPLPRSLDVAVDALWFDLYVLVGSWDALDHGILGFATDGALSRCQAVESSGKLVKSIPLADLKPMYEFADEFLFC